MNMHQSNSHSRIVRMILGPFGDFRIFSIYQGHEI
jgi:hypothetical protein